MIEHIDRSLKDWANSVVKSADVSFAAPNDTQSGKGIGLYLLDLVYKPSASATLPLPHQVSLHYLVTTWAESPEAAHCLLGQLIFAAIENPEFEIQMDSIPVSLWVALHIIPRPAFVLRMPLKRDRPHPTSPTVRVAPEVQISPSMPLLGQVVGPGNSPIVGARVELPVLNRSTVTDTNGQFRFAVVPAQTPIRHLHVTAKGHRFAVSLDLDTAPDEPLIIHLQDLLQNSAVSDRP